MHFFKQSTALFLLLCITSSIFAQSVSKNDLTVTYQQLPLNPLDEEIKTYQPAIHDGGVNFKYVFLKKPLAYVETGTSDNYSSVEKCEKDFLTLEGYDWVTSNPDLTIDAYFKNMEVVSKEAYTKEGTFFENDQKVTRLMYRYKVIFTYYTAFSIKTKDGKVILDEVYVPEEKQHTIVVGDGVDGYGINYFSSAERQAGFENFVANYPIDLTRSWLIKYMNYIDSYLAKPMVTRTFTIGSGKSKKLNYDDLNDAVQHTQDAFMLISSNGLEDEIKEKFQSAITIWEQALEEADYGNKKARINEKIAAMLKQNCAIAYAFIHDFEKSRIYVNEARQHKAVSKWINGVSNFVTDYEKRVNANS